MVAKSEKIVTHRAVIVLILSISLLLVSCGEKTIKGDWTLMYIRVSNYMGSANFASRQQLKYIFTEDGRIKVTPRISDYMEGDWSMEGEYLSLNICLFAVDNEGQRLTFDFDEKHLTFELYDSYGTKYEYFFCREPKHFNMPPQVIYFDTWEELFMNLYLY